MGSVEKVSDSRFASLAANACESERMVPRVASVAGGRTLCQLRGGVLIGDGGLGSGIERRVISRGVTLDLHESAVVTLLRLGKAAEIQRVYQRGRGAVGVRRRGQTGPLRPVRLIPGRKILRQPRHLIGEVVHGDDLVVGLHRSGIYLRLFQEVLLPVLEFLRPFLELVLSLLNLLDGMSALGRIVDNARSKLCVCGLNAEHGGHSENEQAKPSLFHRILSFASHGWHGYGRWLRFTAQMLGGTVWFSYAGSNKSSVR